MYMPLMCCIEWCSCHGFNCMRAIAGGVSAGSSLALASHLLSLLQGPAADPFSACDWSPEWALDPKSFLLGLAAGCLLVLGVQLFCTLRWAFIALVQVHLGGFGDCEQGDRKKSLYKLL